MRQPALDASHWPEWHAMCRIPLKAQLHAICCHLAQLQTHPCPYCCHVASWVLGVQTHCPVLFFLTRCAPSPPPQPATNQRVICGRDCASYTLHHLSLAPSAGRQPLAGDERREAAPGAAEQRHDQQRAAGGGGAPAGAGVQYLGCQCASFLLMRILLRLGWRQAAMCALRRTVNMPMVNIGYGMCLLRDMKGRSCEEGGMDAPRLRLVWLHSATQLLALMV